MKYFGGCDVGSTYTKAVIVDETGKIVSSATIRSKIRAEESARTAMELNSVAIRLIARMMDNVRFHAFMCVFASLYKFFLFLVFCAGPAGL